MNIFEQAVSLGLQANSLVNSSAITYRRQNATVTISDAQKAQKPFRAVTEENFTVVVVPHDWIVRTESLGPLGKPKEGDEITCAGVRYRVSRSDAGEPCWRYHVGSGDSYIRIHTEIIA